MDSGLTTGDLALMRNNNDMDGSSWMWLIAILVLMGGWNNNYPNMPFMNGNYATTADVNEAINNQTLQNQMTNLAVGTANNNYETAMRVNEQTTTLLQQNNTNLINAIQGFNSVQQSIAAQGSQISEAINQLGYHLDQCCCSIKTQMLEDRLTDARAQLVAAQSHISNDSQSQYLLSQLGKFVPTTATTTAG